MKNNEHDNYSHSILFSMFCGWQNQVLVIAREDHNSVTKQQPDFQSDQDPGGRCVMDRDKLRQRPQSREVQIGFAAGRMTGYAHTVAVPHG
jgi:hypothetical protein